eukprot:3624202-Pleurochrysis_carterae.AAC.2
MARCVWNPHPKCARALVEALGVFGRLCLLSLINEQIWGTQCIYCSAVRQRRLAPPCALNKHASTVCACSAGSSSKSAGQDARHQSMQGRS